MNCLIVTINFIDPPVKHLIRPRIVKARHQAFWASEEWNKLKKANIKTVPRFGTVTGSES